MNNTINLIINTSSEETISESFKRIADELLNKYLLKLKHNNKTVQYRIMNIEFYYYHQKKHPDCNTHLHERQKLQNEWYLHKNSINPRYNRKGIDYTFGISDKEVNVYGGILLKKVARLKENTMEKKSELSQSNFINDLIEELQPSNIDTFKKCIEEDKILEFDDNEKIEKKEINSDARKGVTKPCYQYSKYAFSIQL